MYWPLGSFDLTSLAPTLSVSVLDAVYMSSVPNCSEVLKILITRSVQQVDESILSRILTKLG
jgi:hypothetical protein